MFSLMGDLVGKKWRNFKGEGYSKISYCSMDSLHDQG
jgi:hypothetical protein